MKYFVTAILIALALTSCDPQDLTGHLGDPKEDTRDLHDENLVEISELPQAIFDFVNTYFPEATIVRAKLINGLYYVTLSDGTVLILNENGQLEDINSDRNKDKDDDKGEDDDSDDTDENL